MNTFDWGNPQNKWCPCPTKPLPLVFKSSGSERSPFSTPGASCSCALSGWCAPFLAELTHSSGASLSTGICSYGNTGPNSSKSQCLYLTFCSSHYMWIHPVHSLPVPPSSLPLAFHLYRLWQPTLYSPPASVVPLLSQPQCLTAQRRHDNEQRRANLKFFKTSLPKGWRGDTWVSSRPHPWRMGLCQGWARQPHEEISWNR